MSQRRNDRTANDRGVDLLLASSIVAPGTNGTCPEQRLKRLSGVVAIAAASLAGEGAIL